MKVVGGDGYGGGRGSSIGSFVYGRFGYVRNIFYVWSYVFFRFLLVWYNSYCYIKEVYFNGYYRKCEGEVMGILFMVFIEYKGICF